MTIPRPVYDTPELPNPFDLPGMSTGLVEEVIRRGETLRDMATTLDAPGRGGTSSRFERILALRQELMPSDWTASDLDNYSTVVSPCGGHAIAVASGTAGTGDVNGDPQTVRPVGPITKTMVKRNVSQLSLFASDTLVSEKTKQLTWILLTRRAGNVVLAELSLPESCDQSGRVSGWRQRYPLQVIDLGPNGRRAEDSADTDDGLEIAVGIRS